MFGWLSDKIGRKPIILVGCALAALTYFPLFGALTEAANPALAQAQRTAPVVVRADPTTCSLQFDPIGRNKFDTTSCDMVRNYLSKAGVSYDNLVSMPGSPTEVHIGAERLVAPDPRASDGSLRGEAITEFQGQVRAALDAHGYPASADLARINYALVIAILTLLVIYVTMVYGPIAAMLVELFRRASVTRRCRCHIISAMAGSGAFCRRRLSRL